MRENIFRWTAPLFIAVACTAPYLAQAVPVTPADYDGARIKNLFANPSGGLTAHGIIGPVMSYSTTWSISDLGGGNFNYFYNFANLAGLSAAQADIFLQTGTGTGAASLSNIMINGGPINALLGVTVSDATVGGDTGILFDSSLSLILDTISFDVAAAPEWGDFRHGTTFDLLGWVDNTGFGTPPLAPFTNWIARPGAAVAVPEPATMITLGSALLMAFTKRRKQKAEQA